MSADVARRRVVVVGRHGEDTAETAALVEIVRGFVDLGCGEVSVLLQRGGPLTARFASVAPTGVVPDLPRRSPAALTERLLGRVGLRRAAQRVRGRRLGLHRLRAGDTVYLHTVLAVQVLRYLRPGTAAVLCRVPESAHPLRHPLSAIDLGLLLDRVDRFLPVTRVGAEELRGEHGLDPRRVARMPEIIATGDRRRRRPPDEVGRLRRSLGIAADAVVVGSFGASAVDPPSPCASLAVVMRHHTGAPTVLLCVAPEHASDGWVLHDIECAGLLDQVTVLAAVDPSPRYAELCQVVVHTGWGPDHPMAVLEAAADGAPVVCFAGHELADLVGDDEAGFVCPYLDLHAMAERIAALVADPELRDSLGAVASARVHAANGVAGAVPRLWEQIKAVSA